MADVSVIIAAHNVEAYIAKAISSALTQTNVTVEVIVVDDVSTDGTRIVVEGFNDPRVTLIPLFQNKGPGGARNVGIKMASAPWIAVLDGDDSMEPERLSNCLSLAKNMGADIVVDNLLVCREADGATFPMFDPEAFNRHGTIDLTAFITGNQSFLGGYTLGYLKPVFSTDFLRRHNLSYDEALRIGEDYVLMAEALANNAKCVVEKHTGYEYTVRKGSISHRLSDNDVVRIQSGDKKILAKYKLPPAAAGAQKIREKRLREALAFTKLVDAIKGKNIGGCISVIASCPSALRYLWLPVEARLQRLRHRVLEVQS